MKLLKRKETVALLLSIVTLLLIREFWLLSRNGIHVDESLSFMLSAYKNIGMYSIPSDPLTGSKLRELMWFSDYSFSGWASDILNLWKDNRDTPHSNLYYSLLRTWFIFGGGNNRFFVMFWAGQLNIILSAVSMLCVWRIIIGITGSDIIATTAMFIAFISTGSITNTLFLRPYQLQETAFCLYFLMMYFYIVERRNSSSFMVVFGVITAITALTGYFSLILLAMSSIVLLYVYVKRFFEGGDRHIKELIYYIIITLLVLFLVYPPYLFVFGSRQSEALSKASNAIENVRDSIHSLKMLNEYYFLPIYFYSISVFLSIYSLIRNRTKNDFFVLSLLLCVMFWYLIVMFFAPYKVSRYVLPITPMLTISYAYFSFKISMKNNIVAFVLCISFVALSLHQYVNSTVQYQYGNLPKECKYYDDSVTFVITQAYRINSIAQCLQDDKIYNFTNNPEHATRERPQILFSDVEIKDDLYYMYTKKQSYSYFYEYRLK